MSEHAWRTVEALITAVNSAMIGVLFLSWHTHKGK